MAGTLRQGLRKLVAGGLFLRELRALRQEVTQLGVQVARIADALERKNTFDYPTPVASSPDPTLPPTEVTYLNDQEAYDQAVVEMRLTNLLQRPVSEDEILAEVARLRQGPQD